MEENKTNQSINAELLDWRIRELEYKVRELEHAVDTMRKFDIPRVENLSSRIDKCITLGGLISFFIGWHVLGYILLRMAS